MFAPHKKHKCASVRKYKRLMLYKSLSGVVYTEHINTLCRQYVGLLVLNLAVRIVSTGFQRLVHTITALFKTVKIAAYFESI